MKKGAFIVVLILGLSFMINPAQAYGCGKSAGGTEKTCCKKETGDDTEKQNCYTNHHQNTGKNSDDCCKNCKHPLCFCIVVNFAPALLYIADMNKQEFFLPAAEETGSLNEGDLSPGFCTIWLPPKIT